MANDEWISLSRALTIARGPGMSVGAAQAKLIEACASGMVRRRTAPDHDPVLLTADDGIVDGRRLSGEATAGNGLIDAQGNLRRHVQISVDDLRYFLNVDAAPAEDPQSAWRTGARGRPTPKQLVEAELGCRAASLKQGEFLGKSIADVAASLSKWLREKHPAAPQMTAKTISNHLRDKIRPHVVNARN